MFKSPDGKLISVAAVAYLATMASKSSSKAASEAAKKLLLEEVRVNLRKRAEKAAVRQHKKSMAEFARAKEDLTGSFGGPNTMCVYYPGADFMRERSGCQGRKCVHMRGRKVRGCVLKENLKPHFLCLCSEFKCRAWFHASEMRLLLMNVARGCALSFVLVIASICFTFSSLGGRSSSTLLRLRRSGTTRDTPPRCGMSRRCATCATLRSTTLT